MRMRPSPRADHPDAISFDLILSEIGVSREFLREIYADYRASLGFLGWVTPDAYVMRKLRAFYEKRRDASDIWFSPPAYICSTSYRDLSEICHIIGEGLDDSDPAIKAKFEFLDEKFKFYSPFFLHLGTEEGYNFPVSLALAPFISDLLRAFDSFYYAGRVRGNGELSGDDLKIVAAHLCVILRASKIKASSAPADNELMAAVSASFTKEAITALMPYLRYFFSSDASSMIHALLRIIPKKSLFSEEEFDEIIDQLSRAENKLQLVETLIQLKEGDLLQGHGARLSIFERAQRVSVALRPPALGEISVLRFSLAPASTSAAHALPRNSSSMAAAGIFFSSIPTGVSARVIGASAVSAAAAAEVPPKTNQERLELIGACLARFKERTSNPVEITEALAQLAALEDKKYECPISLTLLNKARVLPPSGLMVDEQSLLSHLSGGYRNKHPITGGLWSVSLGNYKETTLPVLAFNNEIKDRLTALEKKILELGIVADETEKVLPARLAS